LIFSSVAAEMRLTFWARADFLKDLSAKPMRQNARSETESLR
jgi:hypothetical protein